MIEDVAAFVARWEHEKAQYPALAADILFITEVGVRAYQASEYPRAGA